MEKIEMFERKRTKVFMCAAVIFIGIGGVMAFAVAGPDSKHTLLETIPAGYRDWRLISVAHEEGNLNDIRAVLGNDAAIKAYREGTIPFPDGAIIARIAWNYVGSEENNRAFGRQQSFVAGSPTNIQFMIKNSREFASTGGWGFSQFSNGKPTHVVEQDCFACHKPAEARDFVFTRYSP
jgi:cytochrome P460